MKSNANPTAATQRSSRGRDRSTALLSLATDEGNDSKSSHCHLRKQLFEPPGSFLCVHFGVVVFFFFLVCLFFYIFFLSFVVEVSVGLFGFAFLTASAAPVHLLEEVAWKRVVRADKWLGHHLKYMEKDLSRVFECFPGTFWGMGRRMRGVRRRGGREIMGGQVVGVEREISSRRVDRSTPHIAIPSHSPCRLVLGSTVLSKGLVWC